MNFGFHFRSLSLRFLLISLGVFSLTTLDAFPAESLAPRTTASQGNADWATYLGDKGRSLYSPLRQINRTNVAQLKVAWTYDTGDKGEYQANNLIINGVLYTPSPTRKVIALDAATGRELWKWNPATERSGAGGGRQRHTFRKCDSR